MGTYPQQSTHDKTEQAGATGTDQDRQGQLDSSPEYAHLLTKYGQAMLRIGQMETTVAHLTKHPYEDGNRANKPEIPVLDQTKSDSRVNDEYQQMRIEITTLTSQLARTEDDLKSIQDKHTNRRRRKQQDKHLWKKLSRRLGLG